MVNRPVYVGDDFTLPAIVSITDSNLPLSCRSTTLAATYERKWQANTAYNINDVVISPLGDKVAAKSAFTSGATFNPTNWNRASITSGGETLNVRTDFGAKGDGVTNDSAAFQAALDYLNSVNGGTLLVPDGAYVVSMVRTYTGINIQGTGANPYGFSSTGRGTVLTSPSVSTTSVVSHFTVSAGGSGYTSAPTVTISGGGGTGATATAYINAGAVTHIRMVDPGSGYTSVPTVTFSGGGGTGATATAVLSTPIIYTSGTGLTNFSFNGFTLRGNNIAGTIGMLIHQGQFWTMDRVHAYGFDREAVWQVSGAGPSIQNGKLFGVNRQGTNLGFHSGSLRISGTDLQMANMEIGGGRSTDQANLWNAAFYNEGSAGQILNCVFEGADVGVLQTGTNNMFTTCRADINYGHGWWITRTVPAFSPPWDNRYTNIWAHRNSRYANNTFDNFHVENLGLTLRNRVSMGQSSYNAADGWFHRYGWYDGAGDTYFAPDCRDLGAGTAAFYPASTSLPNIQIFTANGTWTQPVGATTVRVWAIAGGAGGASGRQGAAATVRCGGGGGGGGGKGYMEFKASDLTSTVSVTVGAGGNGGAAVTTADTNGNAGTNGGATQFGSYFGINGGVAGSGGTASGGSGGSGSVGLIAGGNGAAASSTGAVGNNAGTTAGSGSGGGAGGGITSADVANGGGTSFEPQDKPGAGGANGGTVPGGAGQVGTNRIANEALGGCGGGGGAASTTTAGGKGGNAVLYGGGGGGGGASLNGNASGAGGNGAPGIMVVISA